VNAAAKTASMIAHGSAVSTRMPHGNETAQPSEQRSRLHALLGLDHLDGLGAHQVSQAARLEIVLVGDVSERLLATAHGLDSVFFSSILLP